MRRWLAIPIVALPAGLAALGAATVPGNGARAAPRPAVMRADAARVPRFSKVALLFLENRNYRQIIGNPQAPFLNRLARRGGLATRYYALAHPSLPNYLALTTGSTGGITRDCNSCDSEAPSLPGQLDAAAIPWKAYFQGIPSAGFLGRAAGAYSHHYNPFVYIRSIVTSSQSRSRIVGFGDLRADMAANALPRFSWITPDLLNNGHSGSVRRSDRYAARLVPRIVRALGPRGVLFVTWDEARGRTGPKGGRVALIATGPGARRGVRLRKRTNHYSLLATVESGLRLPALGHAAHSHTRLLTGLLRP